MLTSQPQSLTCWASCDEEELSYCVLREVSGASICMGKRFVNMSRTVFCVLRGVSGASSCVGRCYAGVSRTVLCS